MQRYRGESMEYFLHSISIYLKSCTTFLSIFVYLVPQLEYSIRMEASVHSLFSLKCVEHFYILGIQRLLAE